MTVVPNLQSDDDKQKNQDNITVAQHISLDILIHT